MSTLAALHEAVNQLEYLNEKFPETGTTNQTLAKLRAEIERLEAGQAVQKLQGLVKPLVWCMTHCITSNTGAFRYEIEPLENDLVLLDVYHKGNRCLFSDTYNSIPEAKEAAQKHWEEYLLQFLNLPEQVQTT